MRAAFTFTREQSAREIPALLVYKLSFLLEFFRNFKFSSWFSIAIVWKNISRKSDEFHEKSRETTRRNHYFRPVDTHSLLLSSESLGTRQWASTTLSSRSLRIEALQSTHRVPWWDGIRARRPDSVDDYENFLQYFTVEVKTTWNGWDVTSFSGHLEWTSPHNCSSNLTFLSSFYFHRRVTGLAFTSPNQNERFFTSQCWDTLAQISRLEIQFIPRIE